MPRVYDPERSKEELGHLTGVDAGEERRLEEAAHNAHARQEIQDLENQFSAPSATSASGAPAEELNTSEQNPAQAPASDGQEAGTATQTSRVARLKGKAVNVSKKLLTPKRALIGGGMLSFLIILFLTFSGFSAFELINLRENMLGHGNRYTNNVLERRRARTFARILQKMNKGTFEKTVSQKKFQESFEKRGFILSFDDKGKLTEFKFKASDGTIREFDMKNPDSVAATKAFFGDKGIGLEASRAFDKALSVKGGLWRGPATRSGVYRALRFLFYDWLDRKPSDKAKTNKQKFADALRNSDTPAVDASASKLKSADQLKEENTPKDANGNPIQTDAFDSSEAMDGKFNNGISPSEYASRMRADPTLTDEVLGLGSNAIVDNLANNTEDAIVDGVSDISPEKLGGAAMKGTLEGAVKGLNILGFLQGACEVKGVLNFVNNARNVMLSLELARFALRMFNAADDQKAGILSSTGLNLVMIYLHTPNPKNGKSYYASGGMRYIFGDKTAHPSKENLARYGVGRTDSGVLATIGAFINGIPGMNHCNVVNNGFVTAGGFVIGLGAAVISGGTSAAAQAIPGILLAAAKEVAIQIAIPILIKAGAHMVFNGYENGEMAGDGWASGMGSLYTMVGGANGMRPTTVKQKAALEPYVQQWEQADLAEQSVFYRYFSLHNSQSLTTRMAMAMPHGFIGFSTAITNTATSIFTNATSLSLFSSLFPKASAATDATVSPSCKDPQVQKLGIATDPFCNVLMAAAPELDDAATENILRVNGIIDDQFNPTDANVGPGMSFNEYIKNCFSGRVGILYNADPDTEGSEGVTDDTCTQSGTPLPGDTVGKYDRYAALYGYLVDRDAMVEDLQ